MPKWLKVALILLGLGVLGVGLLVGGLVWWVRANKDRIAREGGAAQRAGKAFGATHAQSECVDDALVQLASCGKVDFMCEAFAKVRLTSCMPVARVDGTCKAVPAPSEIMSVVHWSNLECRRRGQPGSQACGRLMSGVAEACAKVGPGR
ncbi:MAG: hypothetical protein ACRELB_14970 [Polyangiaceae bacterium]